MKVSAKQAYVLENLGRVQPLDYKNVGSSSRNRYQLDGWECSDQIRGLLVRNRIARKPGGALELLPTVDQASSVT